MKENGFLDLLSDAGLEVSDDIPETRWIDTGSYALNALLSSSIFGGIPGNRSLLLAGAPSAGKSYLALSFIKTFLDQNPTAQVIFFDTEFALEKSMVERRGIDTTRFHIIQVKDLHDLRTKMVNFLDKYGEQKKKEKVFLCLDSLSMLPTLKEVTDAASGNDVRDMTKSQIIRSVFRIITNKLGINDIPLIVTSHTYSSMDMYSPVKISGGDGAIYSASTVLTLSKSKVKDGKEVTGNLIKVTTYKSRFSKEAQTVELMLDYETGLDRYYGLLDIAVRFNVIKQLNIRTYELPNGDKVGSKELRENFGKYATDDLLKAIDDVAKIRFGLSDATKAVDFSEKPVLEDTEEQSDIENEE